MPIEVEVPDTKSIIEFPDDTPDLEIDRQVQKHIQEWKAQNAPGPKISAAKKPQEKGWLDTAKEFFTGNVNEGDTVLSRVLSPQPSDPAILRKLIPPKTSDPTLAALDKNQESIFKIPAVRPEVFTPDRGIARRVAKFAG